LSPIIVGEEHYAVARQVQQVLQRYKALQDIIAILGMDELSEEDKTTVARARSSDSCRSRSSSPKCSPARRASLSISPTPSRDSRAWWKASTITCRRPPSTWSAPSKRRSKRARNWRPKPPSLRPRDARFRE